jgi:hypothetical protein
MFQIRWAASILLALAGRLALMLLGAVISLALFHGEGTGHEDRALPAHAGRAYVGDDGEIIHVAPNLEPVGDSRTLVVHGVGGTKLVKVRVSPTGAFWLWLDRPGSDPVGFVLERLVSNEVDSGLNLGRVQLRAEVRTDGSSKFMFVDNRTERIMDELSVDAEGHISSRSSRDHIDNDFRLTKPIDGPGRPEPITPESSEGARASSPHPADLQR